MGSRGKGREVARREGGGGKTEQKRKNRSVKMRAISRKPRPKIEAHKGKMRYPPPPRGG